VLESSFILNTFLVASNTKGYVNFSIVKLGRSIKRQPIEIKEKAESAKQYNLSEFHIFYFHNLSIDT